MTEPKAAAARVRRLRDLFDAVLDLPSGERAGYLLRAEPDAGLRHEVESLVTMAEHETDARLDIGPALVREAGSSLVGTQIGVYKVVALVGEGGMGRVYEAVRADDQYHQRVALKVVQHGLDSALAMARFRRERQILAGLTHSNIATLLDGGLTDDGRPFLVMEFIEGAPITVWCDANGASVRERLALFRQVCAAVGSAHRNLVIHRDLKPGNVLVTPDGTVKLLDFGIAKMLGDEAEADGLPLTRGGARVFTPEYASPEQIRGDVLTTASDVYSLGVLLFELLAGRRPFVVSSGSTSELEQRVLSETAPRPSAVARAGPQKRVSEDLDLIVLKALRKEPERRYPSVEALDDDVRRWLAGLPVRAHGDAIDYRIGKFIRRNAVAVTAAVLVVAALVGGVVSTAWQARRARAEQATAERTSRFLRELLSSVKPAMEGRDVPASELLDSAAARIGTELAGEPAAQAEIEAVVGRSYQALGHYDPALVHLSRSLRLYERVSGPGSDAAIGALSSVAALHLARGELPLADTLFGRALALQRRRHAEPDTATALLLQYLGSVAHSRGEPAAAERLHREALAIRKRILPPGDDMIAYSLNDVGVALGEQGQWAAAESLHRAAVSILRRNHQRPYPLLADALNGLAGALDLQGKNAAADSAYRAVIALRRQLLGPEHPDYAFTVFNYAGFVFDQGRYTEALALAREVLALRGRTLPESHSAVAAALQTAGRSLDKLGDTEGGGRALMESVALRRRYLPADSWLIANSESVLGEHFTLTREFVQAAPLLRHASLALERALGPNDPRVAAVHRRKAALYAAWGRTDPDPR
ncbi:MAG: serine/threonine-protein kinase [Gemmatimonadota bacterium]